MRSWFFSRACFPNSACRGILPQRFQSHSHFFTRGHILKPKDRYDTTDLEENQFESGSRRRVLKNLLAIAGKRDMDRLEGREQIRVLEELASLYDSDHRFTAADVCRIHQLWLVGVYSWAGKYRQVNVRKGTFSFAAAAQIPKLMMELEKGALTRHTPCHSASTEHLHEKQ